MKSIYIYHHLGLGDHIICNGLVRHYAMLYDKIYVFCKPHNIQNVCYMFRDNQNIKIISSSNKQAESFISKNKQNNYLILRTVGDFNTFDKVFYSSALIPFEYKWDKFYFKRNVEKEKDVFYNKLGLNDSIRFIFVHDDMERSISADKLLQNKFIRIVKPDRQGISIFDFLYTIEKAKEVHCIDSSFLNLIDCIQLRKEGLFFHKYVRLPEIGENGTPILKMNWKIIN